MQIIVALALAWSLCPGTHELTEQVVHLVQNGHFAHPIPDDPDSCPTDSEHGCQGPMHLCRCCRTVPLMLAAGALSIAPPVSTLAVAQGLSVRRDDPHLDGVFHPPKA